MITHLKLRLAASALTLAAILHPDAAQCQATAPAAVAVLPHVSVTVMGRGAPVILIPGLASPRATWDGIAPHLAEGHRVYLVQVNGFGGDAPGANLAPGMLDGIVADLHSYIAANGLDGAAVIGHSMGGLLGLMLAKAYPGDVRRLMVVDALPWFGALMAPPGSAATMADARPIAARLRDGIAATYGKPADPAVIEANTRGMALTPEAQAKLHGWAAKADARVTAEAMYEDVTTDLRPDLPRIQTPITLIAPWHAGTYSREQMLGFYQRQYAGTPHLAVIAIDNAAHFVMLDQPAAFEAAVDAFLK